MDWVSNIWINWVSNRWIGYLIHTKNVRCNRKKSACLIGCRYYFRERQEEFVSAHCVTLRHSLFVSAYCVNLRH